MAAVALRATRASLRRIALSCLNAADRRLRACLSPYALHGQGDTCPQRLPADGHKDMTVGHPGGIVDQEGVITSYSIHYTKLYDAQYEAAGAEVLGSPQEIWHKADVIVKVT